MTEQRQAVRGVERGLAAALYAGIALVLLTPLVWAPDAFHPFSVGKAVYARSLIAALFALWAVLATWRPCWRPPPTVILGAFLAGLAVSALSAGFGVSPQRSLWSTYTRMEGLVDSAHWAAFAVVLMATVRTDRDWDRLLTVNLCVGLAVALVAVLRFHAPNASLLDLPPESRYPRISGTTGNPTFLGAYLQAVALLSAGFLARSWRAPTGAPPAGRSRIPPRGTAPSSPWPARLFWAATLTAAVYALTLTGSMGALAGLGTGLAVAAALHALLGRTRLARRLGLGGLVALGLAASALALVLVLRAAAPPGGEADRPAFDSVLLERVTDAGRIANTLAPRRRNWESGLKAFAERPVIGWGTGNYFVASARHISEPPKRTLIRDHAHNMVLEEAATKGLAGLAAYFLLWGAIAVAVVRRARVSVSREQTLAIFAGAALAGWFVQSQILFYAPSIRLQHTLLLAFAAYMEASAPRGRLLAACRRAAEALRRRTARLAVPARVAAAVAALVLAFASITAQHAIHTGNAAIARAEFSGPFLENLERAMRAFEPLANGPRVILFNNVAANWPVLAAHHPAEARRLLAWSGDEAAAALAAEPESWVIHHALARLYRAAAETHPEYAGTAKRHFERSLALAPNLDPLQAPLGRAPGM